MLANTSLISLTTHSSTICKPYFYTFHQYCKLGKKTSHYDVVLQRKVFYKVWYTVHGSFSDVCYTCIWFNCTTSQTHYVNSFLLMLGCKNLGEQDQVSCLWNLIANNAVQPIKRNVFWIYHSNLSYSVFVLYLTKQVLGTKTTI